MADTEPNGCSISPLRSGCGRYSLVISTHAHTEVVQLLVAAGANVAAKNAQGKSVRQLADQCRSTAVIAALTPSAV